MLETILIGFSGMFAGLAVAFGFYFLFRFIMARIF